jgi:hypothetical protein
MSLINALLAGLLRNHVFTQLSTMNDLHPVHKELENQVSFLFQIVSRSHTPLSQNMSYQIQRAKFYGMLKVYQLLGGTREYKIPENGL